MHQHPAQKLHHQLNNIQHWHHNYPTKHELIFTKPLPPLRHTTTPADRLPFGADRWLDEPALGAEGAKTWPEIWDNLASWLRAWQNELPTTGTSWERLHALVDLLAADHEEEFYDYEHTVHTIHKRMKNIMAAPVLGEPCLTCARPMHKIMTPHGWQGHYHCPTCKNNISHEDWEKHYLEQLKQSTIPLTTTQITQLFGITKQRLNAWKKRGKIIPITDRDGKKCYLAAGINRLIHTTT